jgi:hypothetical protein
MEEENEWATQKNKLSSALLKLSRGTKKQNQDRSLDLLLSRVFKLTLDRKWKLLEKWLWSRNIKQNGLIYWNSEKLRHKSMRKGKGRLDEMPVQTRQPNKCKRCGLFTKGHTCLNVMMHPDVVSAVAMSDESLVDMLNAE